MADDYLERTQVVPTSLDETFAFFAEPRNLEVITPPWLHFRIVEAPERVERDSLVRYRLRLFRIPVGWLTAITEWDPPHRFVDEQLRGPYSTWIHEHRLEARDGGTAVLDRVRYRIPLGPLGALAGRLFVRRLLDEIFDFRAERTAAFLTAGTPAPTLR